MVSDMFILKFSPYKHGKKLKIYIYVRKCSIISDMFILKYSPYIQAWEKLKINMSETAQ